MGGGNSNLLNITVLAYQIESKGLVTGEYLDSGSSIGVTVTNTSGGNYDNSAYNNIQFTSSGTGTSQKWSGGTVKLSATDGYCFAYYPYSSSATSITAIPVTAGGTDFMYATPVTVNDKDKDVTLNMKHALAAIRFALKKGTYTGTGAVTSVEVASSALGSSGTLNAKTGDVTANGLGTAVSQSAGFNLETTAKNVDVVMVPSGNAGTITLSVTIDGKVYSTEVSTTTIEKGSCYTYTITVDAGSLALSGVKVGDWGYSNNGSPTITAGGYTVTITGDYEDIAFGNSVSGNTVTIKAINYDGYAVKEVSASSNATLTQSISNNTRVIILTDITANVIVTFNGVVAPPVAIADSWEGLADGVYAVRPDLKPANIENGYEGNSLCIGVGLVNTAKSQLLMVEKYENANNAESTNIYTKAAQQLNGSSTYLFTWGGYGTDQSAIISYDVVGAGSSGSGGYLHLDNSGLSIDPSTWSSGALSDFAGKSNSEVIKNITTNGTSSSTYAPMAFLMNAFNASDCPKSVNQGYRDWYVPSCGQLGLIWLNLTAINNALTAIGGTTLAADFYWSSSECNNRFGWIINLSNGFFNSVNKYNKNQLRLVRNL